MSYVDNNVFPKFLVVETAAPAVSGSGDYPGISSGNQALYIDPTSHHLSRKDHAGTVVDLETNQGGGSAAMTLISQQTLGSDAASVTFSSIAGSYKSLILEVQTRSDQASAPNLLAQFNSDTGSNYDWTYTQYATGGSPTGGSLSAQTSGFLGFAAPSGAPAGSTSIHRLTIPNYAGTAWQKTYDCLNTAHTAAGAHYIVQIGGTWLSAAAITAIKILPSAGNLKSGTVCTLWGVS